jgi:cell division protein FtsN
MQVSRHLLRALRCSYSPSHKAAIHKSLPKLAKIGGKTTEFTMTIDYAKKQAPATPATKKNSRKAKFALKQSNSPPAWVWLFTGLALGLLIAFLYHLATLPTPGVTIVEKSTPQQPTADASDTRFDFYTLLPENEVIVDRSSATQADETKYVYFLQAGSFVKDSDAEQRRAELGLLGFEANIEKFSNKGTTWHRVQMGPLASRSKLSAARSQLIQEGIDTMVIKRKVN